MENNKFFIISGNIFDYLSDKDLIVNSANENMQFGSGICGQIYKKAGVRTLEEYCKNTFGSRLGVNEVRFTPGFSLGIDILHIYCPKQYVSKNPNEELLESYTAIFDSVSKTNYRKVISISLGTGVHGYKHEVIGKLVANHIESLTKKNDIEFTLVLPNEEIKALYLK